MISSKELAYMFFSDLKKYNNTNFKSLQNCNENSINAIVYKSFSSVVTRFFIFVEKHPEICESDIRMLYFKLKIDMIARYFSEFPASSFEDLRPFQNELLDYVDTKLAGGEGVGSSI